MRMQKFRGGGNGFTIGIDLDQVISLEQPPEAPTKTEIWLPNNVTITVDMPIDDVLAMFPPNEFEAKV